MSPEDSQSAFEAHFRARPGLDSPVWTTRTVVKNRAYCDYNCELAWRTWCAALEWVASQQPEVQR
jgi:hypothetical protein